MKLSIVVPVYNVEKYLRRCLDSILAQEWIDWECILVDDGSPDACPGICDEYSQKDNRFRVIHKQNEGLKKAVERGIVETSGEYVGFVDSDDWIEKDMYSTMMNLVVKYNLDVCACNYRYVYENGSLNKSVNFGIAEGLYVQDCNLEEFFDKMLPRLDDGRYVAGTRWNKIFKKEIIAKSAKENNKAVAIAEDTYIVHPALLESKRIYYINKDFYNYFRNEASITGKYKPIYLQDWKIVTNIYEQYIDKFSRLNAIEDAKFFFLCINVISFIFRSNIAYIEKRKYIKEVIKDKYVQEVVKSVCNSCKNRMYKKYYYILRFHLSELYLLYVIIKNKIRKLIKRNK